MRISSQAFTEGSNIPRKYTKYGENCIPPIHFDDVPVSARSLAMIVDDPDAPRGTFNHWLLFNLDPALKDIPEDSLPSGATQGRNDFGKVEYGGPRPPSGEHRYFFKAFALDTVLPLGRGCKRDDLDKAMAGHVLESATLMGRYTHWQSAHSSSRAA